MVRRGLFGTLKRPPEGGLSQSDVESLRDRDRGLAAATEPGVAEAGEAERHIAQVDGSGAPAMSNSNALVVEVMEKPLSEPFVSEIRSHTLFAELNWSPFPSAYPRLTRSVPVTKSPLAASVSVFWLPLGGLPSTEPQ